VPPLDGLKHRMNDEDQSAPDLKLAGLSLWVEGRERSSTEDFWDANWLRSRVRVEAPGATVALPDASIRIDELAAFEAELQTLYRELKGTAALACIDAALAVRVAGDGRGHMRVEVDVTPDMLAQRHWFGFSTDQSHLPDTLAALGRLLATYEVGGRS